MTTTANTVHVRASEQSNAFTREFAAPVALVFRAHVEPELFAQWVGPRGTSCAMRHFDARTGGAFSYVIADNFAFFGSYHEVTAPTRIVHSWEFEGDSGRPTLETLTFVDLGPSRCRIEGLSLYTSAKQCAEMLAYDQSGEGMDENFERLDALLSTLR